MASWWDSRAPLLPGFQEGRAQREGGEPGAQGPSSTHLCKHACPGAPRIWGPGRQLTRLSAQAVSRGLFRVTRCSRPLGSPPAPDSSQLGVCPPHPGQAGPSPRQLTKPAALARPYCSAPAECRREAGRGQRRTSQTAVLKGSQPGGETPRVIVPGPPRATCLGQGGEHRRESYVSLGESRGWALQHKTGGRK